MVSPSYLLDKPPGPSRLKTWVDQRAIPAAIDAAASGEFVLERAAAATRRAPLLALGVAFLAGTALAAALVPPPRPSRWKRAERLARDLGRHLSGDLARVPARRGRRWLPE